MCDLGLGTSAPSLSVGSKYSAKNSRPSSWLRSPDASSIASFSSDAAMRIASPEISVCRDPEVVPESGATSEFEPMLTRDALGRPVISATIWTKTVALPWPISDAAQ